MTPRLWNRNSLYYSLLPAMLLCCVGCNGVKSASETDFEAGSADSPLPDGWELVIHRGTYQLAAVQGAHRGQTAVAIAGAGGTADILGPMVTLKPAESLQFSVWLDAEAFADANASVGCVVGATSEAENFHPLLPVNAEADGYQEYGSVFELPDGYSGEPVRMAVRLNGEGLLRIDDAKFQKVIIMPQYQLQEGFEDETVISEGKAFMISSDAQDVTVSRSKKMVPGRAGVLHVFGRNGWCSVISTLRVPVADHRVSAEVMVRVRSGVGHLKIEYFSGDRHIDSTRAEVRATGGWQKITTQSVPESMDQADNVRVSIAAVHDFDQKPFDVEFDDLRLQVIKPAAGE